MRPRNLILLWLGALAVQFGSVLGLIYLAVRIVKAAWS